MRFADLHTHTTHSDGARSPRELIEAAAEHKLDIVAVTDHDTVGALPAAREAAGPLGITVIAGVELSVSWRGHDVHLLGFAFDETNPALLEALGEFRDVRDSRGETMVERLNEIGVSIEMDHVRRICGNASFGRPHVARALVEQGHCASVNEAFDRWLARGKPGFVPKKRFSAESAIKLVHEAGGLTSLAHPTLYDQPLVVIGELAPLGLDGVEVHHPKVPPAWSSKLREACKAYGLIETGGSDDHGFEDKKTIGQIRVPESSIEPILSRVELSA